MLVSYTIQPDQFPITIQVNGHPAIVVTSVDDLHAVQIPCLIRLTINGIRIACATKIKARSAASRRDRSRQA